MVEGQVGLVLEGGGMRGAYTGGVLEIFMENMIFVPYVIGVSAGACNGSSYVSKQIERNRKVTIDFAKHPEYISFKRFFHKRELFGMDFLFDELPNRLVPFDYDTFYQAQEKFVVGVTDCLTGEPVYYEKDDVQEHILTILRASSSLPFMAPIIEFDGRLLMDGGISDPIPIKKAEQDGNRKNIVILTRNQGYYKKSSRVAKAFTRFYRDYPGLVHAIQNRYHVYNDTISYLEEKEKRGDVFIIRPKQPLTVSRIERDQQKLTALYEQGQRDARELLPQLQKWLKDNALHEVKSL